MKDVGLGRLCVCMFSFSVSVSLFLTLSLSLFLCVYCVFKPKDNLRYYFLGNHLPFFNLMYMNICLHICIHTMCVPVVDRKEGQIF